MENKKELLDAIDNYYLLSKIGRAVLKALIRMEVEDLVITTSEQIRAKCVEFEYLPKQPALPSIYNVLRELNKQGFVECNIKQGSRVSSYKLKPSRFEQIITHYRAKSK